MIKRHWLLVSSKRRTNSCTNTRSHCHNKHKKQSKQQPRWWSSHHVVSLLIAPLLSLYMYCNANGFSSGQILTWIAAFVENCGRLLFFLAYFNSTSLIIVVNCLIDRVGPCLVVCNLIWLWLLEKLSLFTLKFWCELVDPVLI